MRSSILPLAFAPALAFAQMTMDVDVGKDDKFVFTPDTLSNVAMGTVINFHFYNPGSHSVAQSSYDSPCMPSGDDAVWSGFFPGPSGESDMMFSMTVNSTDPLWLYCATGDHCQDGMAMVINPPSSDQTLMQYMSSASSVGMNVAPTTDVQGGIVVANSAASSGGSMGGSSSGAMSPTGTSSSMMGGSETSPAMGSAQSTGAAAQAKGVVGAAALGLLGAILA